MMGHDAALVTAVAADAVIAGSLAAEPERAGISCADDPPNTPCMMGRETPSERGRGRGRGGDG